VNQFVEGSPVYFPNADVNNVPTNYKTAKFLWSQKQSVQEDSGNLKPGSRDSMKKIEVMKHIIPYAPYEIT
jgi:hypothetical protein